VKGYMKPSLLLLTETYAHMVKYHYPEVYMILEDEIKKLVEATVKIVKTPQEIEEAERKKKEALEQGGAHY